jgi:hypothetical protein
MNEADFKTAVAIIGQPASRPRGYGPVAIGGD